ncbi:hypothetical protein ACXZ1M_26995 [Duganella sp. PWIR1]
MRKDHCDALGHDIQLRPLGHLARIRTRKIMSLPQYITINGTSYASQNLSEAAKAQAVNVQVVDAELARLQQQIAIAQTARNAYVAALIESVKGKGKADAAEKPKKAVAAEKPKKVVAAEKPKKAVAAEKPKAPRKPKAAVAEAK